MPDLEFAHTVVLIESDPIDDAPILDLRIRKGVRRHHVKVAVASARPTALDARADVVQRIPPGGGAALLVSLADDDSDFVRAITAAGEDIVIVYGERLLAGPRGEVAAKALLNLAARLGLAGRPGAGLLEIPATTNGRGLREAGFAPGYGPGFATLAEPGRGAPRSPRGSPTPSSRRSTCCTPTRCASLPDRALWKTALEHRAGRDRPRVRDDRDGARVRRRRLPRRGLRREGGDAHAPRRPPPAPAHRDRPPAARRVRAAACAPAGRSSPTSPSAPGTPPASAAGPIASRRLFEAVPFYAGLTLDEIGGQGVRWQERDAAASFEVPAWEPVDAEGAALGPRAAKGALRLGTYRSLWSSKEVDVSPALHFLRAQQVVELSPADAKRLGIADGDRVEVGSNGTRVRGAVRLRDAIPRGHRVPRRRHAAGRRQPADRAARGDRARRRAGERHAARPSSPRASPRCCRPRR